MNQISPLAFVHPDAKLGDNNIIGPFCYIDADVVIGDNNVFQNSVTLNQGLRMGSNNEVFPGASLSTKPQDLKFHGEITTCEIGDNSYYVNREGKRIPSSTNYFTDVPIIEGHFTKAYGPEKLLPMIMGTSVK